MELLTFEPVVDVEENQLQKIEELEERLKDLPGGEERNDINYEILKYRKQYKLRVLENDLKEAVSAIGDNFLKIGALLVDIDNGYLYTAKFAYGSIYDYAEGVLGLKRTTTKNLMAVSRTYCGGTAILNPQWEKFKYTQLVVMLPLSPEQRKQITPDMTVKQILEYKQKLCGQLIDQNCENSEEEINKIGQTSDQEAKTEPFEFGGLTYNLDRLERADLIALLRAVDRQRRIFDQLLEMYKEKFKVTLKLPKQKGEKDVSEAI